MYHFFFILYFLPQLSVGSPTLFSLRLTVGIRGHRMFVSAEIPQYQFWAATSDATWRRLRRVYL